MLAGDVDDATLQALRPGATIRGATQLPQLADTLPRLATETLRELPRLSVDLRTPSGAVPDAPATQTDLEVRGVIGEGGMGRVLLARQHSLTRDVAVKTARDEASAAAREAILWEGAISGQLEHPSIVPVHALGLDAEGRPALVMKRIEGVSWDALVANPAHAGWEGWEGTEKDRLAGHLQILISVCNALHFAHSKGVIHRDIKPENVLIGRFSDVYLADWGVATRIIPGPSALCGTPAYMAPEMAEAGPVDARTDVYLLGATLHLILTGTLRHPGPTAREAVEAAKRAEPYDYPPSVPRELAALANSACHKDPAQRPPSAKAFKDELVLFGRHREARALVDQAIRRVEEAEALLKVKAPTQEQQIRIERLLAEARFGLEQVLTQWSDNLTARQALVRLEAILEQRRARAAQLEHAARERDPHTGLGMRMVSLGGLLLLNLGISTIAWTRDRPPTPIELALYSTVIGAATAIGAFALRRRVLTTAFNRQIFAGMMVAVVLMLLGRLLGLLTPISPADHFARDAFVLSATTGMMGITLLRYGTVLAVVFAISGALCLLRPPYAVLFFSGATELVVAIALAATWAAARRK